MIAAAPTTTAPAARATSIVSLVEPPVVTTSSTTSTFSPGSERESASERQLPVLALGEDGADAKRAADFLADDDAAQRRRQHRLRAEAAHAIRERRAERFGLARMLQHERALQVAGAVQSGRQAEVALEERARAAKAVEDGRGVHGVIRIA